MLHCSDVAAIKTFFADFQFIFRAETSKSLRHLFSSGIYSKWIKLDSFANKLRDKKWKELEGGSDMITCKNLSGFFLFYFALNLLALCTLLFSLVIKWYNG